ncbi:MAG: DtxR family transcriptional regulator [Firmicutes bacterium]|nr:DtxR family transcriptional regulator [Bacillota bacterium]
MNSKKFYTVRGYEILGKKNKLLSHSMEDYLEMIYRNSLTEGHVRINMLAESLNVQAPSATKMVQKLAKLGYLNYEKYGLIQLTQEGVVMGKYLLKRHEIIERFLLIIGVEERLLENVELIEHSVTKGALNKIEILNKFFETYPDVLSKLQEFRTFMMRDNI